MTRKFDASGVLAKLDFDLFYRGDLIDCEVTAFPSASSKNKNNNPPDHVFVFVSKEQGAQNQKPVRSRMRYTVTWQS